MLEVRSAGRAARVCLALAALSGLVVRSASAQVPSPWVARDIGAPTPAGSSSYNSTSGTFSITAGGADIWGTSDQFHFIYQAISGDVEVIARVDSITQAYPWSKSGVMIRASLAANAAHASAFVSAAKGVAFHRRPQTGGSSTNTSGGLFTAPRWVRVVRAGTRVTAYSSADGTTWSTIASDTIALGTTAYVGIATTSHNSSMVTNARVSRVAVNRRGLPSGQRGVDIGAPAIRGSVSYNQGTYTISAAGADIWGTSDQFYFVYQQVTGDADVRMRVASIGYVYPWSKAGAMIRESLAADSAHATTFLTAGKGYAFHRRGRTGDISDHTSGGAGTAPGWVRVRRTGSLFTAYRSSDGRTWTVIGSDTIPMVATVYVGIAVTSHDVSAATTAVVDNLSVVSTPNLPPVVSLTAPANGSQFTAPATIALTASATDPDGQLSRVEFYSGSTRLSSDTAAPYSFSWTSVPAGTYSLTAVAYDTAGASTTSAPIAITVSAVTTPPRYVQFNASPDHTTLVSSYRFDVFQSGANPATATPVATLNLGKPTPDANGIITVDALSFFTSLAAGNYIATVSAIGSSGSSRSAAVSFTR